MNQELEITVQGYVDIPNNARITSLRIRFPAMNVDSRAMIPNFIVDKNGEADARCRHALAEAAEKSFYDHLDLLQRQFELRMQGLRSAGKL